jgi:hypothetical protein
LLIRSAILPSDADNKGNFRVSSFVEVATLLSQAAESDFGSLQRSVFLDVTLSSLEDDLSVCFVFLHAIMILIFCPVISTIQTSNTRNNKSNNNNYYYITEIFNYLAELLDSLLLFSSASFDGLFVLEEGLGDSNPENNINLRSKNLGCVFIIIRLNSIIINNVLGISGLLHCWRRRVWLTKKEHETVPRYKKPKKRCLLNLIIFSTNHVRRAEIPPGHNFTQRVVDADGTS